MLEKFLKKIFFFSFFFIYSGSNYNLLKHNCNTFSEDLCQFLCGSSIPKYILDLPQELLSTPIGQSLAPLIESLSARTDGSTNFSFEPQITAASPRSPSPDLIEINTQIEQIRAQSNAIEESRKKSLDKIARREHKKEKKKKKHRKTSNSSEKVSSSEGSDYNSAGMSELETNGTANGGDTTVIPSEMLPSEKVLEEEAEERRAEEEKKRNREPPIVFKEIDVSTLTDVSNYFEGIFSEFVKIQTFGCTLSRKRKKKRH
jgi:hypothetical protein